VQKNLLCDNALVVCSKVEMSPAPISGFSSKFANSL